MPVFVPKSAASLWSGAPSSIMLPYSSCGWHSKCARASVILLRMDTGLVVFAEVSVSGSGLCYYANGDYQNIKGRASYARFSVKPETELYGGHSDNIIGTWTSCSLQPRASRSPAMLWAESLLL